MPLYELLSISKVPIHHSIRMPQTHKVISRTAKRLFEEEALIRDIKYMGIKQLPYRMKLTGEYQTEGAYWLIFFYSGAQSVKRIKKELSADIELIRCTITKQGDKLKDYVHFSQ